MTRRRWDRVVHGWLKYGWRAPVFALGELESVGEAAARRARRIRLMLRCVAEISPSAIIEEDVFVTARARLKVGDGAFIGRRSILEISNGNGCEVSIGASSWLSHDCHISCSSTVRIGRDVLIGEFCSLRDASHRYDDPLRPIREQGDVVGPIEIQDGVWIGRGVLVLSRPGGTVIGRNSIIAANSTVHCDVPSDTVWGGTPARLIRAR